MNQHNQGPIRILKRTSGQVGLEAVIISAGLLVSIAALSVKLVKGQQALRREKEMPWFIGRNRTPNFLKLLGVLLWATLSVLPARSQAKDFTLVWAGEKLAPCQKLVTEFVRLTKDISNQDSFTLTLDPNAQSNQELQSQRKTTVTLQCPKNSADLLELTNYKTTLALHYIQSAQDFDAQDWLKFQQNVLNDTSTTPSQSTQTSQTLQLADVGLSGVAKATSNTNANGLSDSPLLAKQEANQDAILEDATPYYKKWWFWTLVVSSAGALGYGIYQGVKPHRQLTLEFK